MEEIEEMTTNEKIAKVREKMAENKIDAVIVPSADGRYYVQAERQLAGSEGVLFKMNEPETPKVPEYLAKELSENAVVGINGELFSAAYIKSMQEAFAKKNIQINNQVDYANDLWEDRPAESATEIYTLPVKYAGKTAAEKIGELREKLCRCHFYQCSGRHCVAV